MSQIDKFYTLDIDLDSMGIAYHDNDLVEYDETPLGAVIFASMGVDGVHYCIVPKESASIEESPVYAVSPSDGEDTVVWAAKNFIDFLSIGIAMRSFAFISSCHLLSKKEFLEILENYCEEDDSEKEATDSAISILRKEFPITDYKDARELHAYIKKTYKDKSNHTKLKFNVPDIKAGRLGHFNID